MNTNKLILSFFGFLMVLFLVSCADELNQEENLNASIENRTTEEELELAVIDLITFVDEEIAEHNPHGDEMTEQEITEVFELNQPEVNGQYLFRINNVMAAKEGLGITDAEFREIVEGILLTYYRGKLLTGLEEWEQERSTASTPCFDEYQTRVNTIISGAVSSMVAGMFLAAPVGILASGVIATGGLIRAKYKYCKCVEQLYGDAPDNC